MNFLSSRKRPRESGFTLIEVLIATALFALIIAAINTVFFSALHLRDKAYEMIEDSAPGNQAASIIQKDLSGCLSTGGLLAGAMTGELSNDFVTGSPRLEFYTNTGVLRDDLPWGDVQRVAYYLAEPLDSSPSESSRGRDLIRAVTRNLLATIEEPPEERAILHGVKSLQFYYFNGEEWQETWDSESDTQTPSQTSQISTGADSEAQESTLPKAIRVHIEFVEPEAKERSRIPLEFVVAVATRGLPAESETNTEQSTSGNSQNSGSQNGGSNSGGGSNNSGR